MWTLPNLPLKLNLISLLSKFTNKDYKLRFLENLSECDKFCVLHLTVLW